MVVSICMGFPMNVYALRSTIDRMVAADKSSSETQFLVETAMIVFSAFGVCIAVPNIGKIFDVTGATGCMLLNFLLPCIFLAALEKNVRLMASFVAAVGTISSLITLAMMI